MKGAVCVGILKKPKFIMFDYGQTLVREFAYDGARGYDELLKYASGNPNGVTGAQLQGDIEELNRELGRFNPATRHKRLFEFSEESINRYIFAKRGVTFDRDLRELEPIFWNTANPCTATDGVADLLDWLREQGIRTGVVSNLSFCSETLRQRIAGCLPDAAFEFVISSCDYVFRKPSPHIFEVALAKAGVPAEDVWFCGDQFPPDIQGSGAVGITPVWYKQYLLYDSDRQLTEGLEIHSWEELRKIIASLEAIK